MIENAHKHLERAPPDKPRLEILIEAASEVGPALFFSLLIITVSFLPIFTLEAQEGRLFSPLAFTKTSRWRRRRSLSVTLVPALMVHLHARPDRSGSAESAQPLPDLDLPAGDPRRPQGQDAHHRAGPCRSSAISAWPASSSAPNSCRTLNEGTLFYMPTTLPGISVTKAAELLQMQDRIIKSFPEVESRVRQGRPRHDRDRSGADGDV